MIGSPADTGRTGANRPEAAQSDHCPQGCGESLTVPFERRTALLGHNVRVNSLVLASPELSKYDGSGEAHDPNGSTASGRTPDFSV